MNVTQKIHLLLIFAGYSLTSYCQQNLIVNPSFEYVLDNNACNNSTDPDYSNALNHWALCPPWTLPERLIPIVGRVGSSDFFCESGVARTGTIYGRCLVDEPNVTESEYIVQQIQSLTFFNVYYLEYFVKGVGLYKSAGVLVSPLKPVQKSFLIIDAIPTVPISDNLSLNMDTWTKISGFFVSPSTNIWITFGNFGIIGPSVRQLLIDDFRIIDLGLTASEMRCPEILGIEKITYDDMALKFQASSLLRAGFDASVPNRFGDVLVKNNSDIIYKAGNEVALLPGFGVEQGANFSAYMPLVMKTVFPLPHLQVTIQLSVTTIVFN